MGFLNHTNITNASRFHTIINLTVALYICSAVINFILVAAIPSLNGAAMAVLYAAVSLILFASLVYNKIKMSVLQYFFFVLIAIWYMISRYVLGVSDLSEPFFIVFFVIPFLLCSIINVEIEFVIKMVLLFSCGGLFFIDKIFVVDEIISSIYMGTSYAFLTPIVASVVYFALPTKKNVFFTFLACSNIVYLGEIVLHGSRGTILGFFCACLLLFSFSKKDRDKKYMRLILLCLLVIGIYFYFWDIVEFVYSFLSANGMRVRIIEKLIKLQMAEGVLNGRDIVYQITVDGIKEKLFLGHGISSFDYYTNLDYPHNILLQMLYDTGIVGSLMIFIPVLVGIRNVFLGEDKNKLFWGIFLFSISIPRSLFSGNVWEIPSLWLTLGFFINNMSVQKEACYESFDKKL